MLEHLRIYDETILKIYNVSFDSRSFCVTMMVVVVGGLGCGCSGGGSDVEGGGGRHRDNDTIFRVHKMPVLKTKCQ
jgi:hypothetical protein